MSFASDLRDSWDNPPSIYRSAPFWSWNAKLEPQRLQAEIRSMHAAGMGGFFMHSRYGLKTPYLSKEWFTCVSACVEQARELGMKAYLYDEDRWPSGAAGGLVTRDNPEFQMHSLVGGTPQAVGDEGENLASFTVRLDEGNRLISYEPVVNLSDAPPDQRTVTFHVCSDIPVGWFNDGTYLDTLSADAVAEFIRVTHRAYADRYGEDFGDLIPAIFTDEPNYARSRAPKGSGRISMPWTSDLPRQFRQRRGYDVREHLPELLFARADGGFSKVMYDYLRTCTELFVENFSQQIGEWCGKHGIASTGHMLSEPDLYGQCTVIGAAMPHYEHMQWPGIDILTDSAQELATAKQCSSVADQLGHERVLSELYGCTGWDWPLAGHKFVGDWQFAAGVNFRCPHLTHYSLEGGAKRDYPASIFSHSPWWDYYHTVEGYFGRLSLMLTQGTPVRDVLVLHPIETGWALYRPGAGDEQTSEFWGVQKTWRDLMYTLANQHYDFDLGDESLLEKHGKVSGAKFQVGRMSYQVVIVPPVRTLRTNTLNLLRRFLGGGGKVLFLGEAPDHVDAQPSGDARALAQQAAACPSEPDQYLPVLEGLLPRRVSITEDGREFAQCWTMLRSVQGGQLLFVQSHDRTAPHRLRVSVQARRPVVEWRSLDGQCIRVKSQAEGDRVVFEIDLPPTGSALLSLGVSVPDALTPPKEPRVLDRRELAGPLAIERTEPNTLPLDYCRYAVGDAPLSEPVPSLQADAEIRRHFGLGERNNYHHQPWYLYATGVIDLAQRGPARTVRTFHVTTRPAACKLALEGPDYLNITVNGKPVPEPDGWWVDLDIRTIDITDLLVEGDNEILAEFNYRPDMELEDMYLVGDFGVAKRPGTAGPQAPDNMTLIAPPTSLALGSWIGQGLDFYGGAVRYTVDLPAPPIGRRVRVSLPGIDCTAAALHVNGATFVLPWAPFTADVTDALPETGGPAVIEVIGGRKNILGPLHTPWKPWTGPGEFHPGNAGWVRHYLLKDHGLTAPVVVEITE